LFVFCLFYKGSKMRKFVLSVLALTVVSTIAVAGPLGNMRKRAEERREARHTDHAEIVVGKDGKPALRWADGSTSLIGKDKDGKLIAAPKIEGTKTLKQSHGPEIKLIPGAKVN
jgi:hypothetical protein